MSGGLTWCAWLVPFVALGCTSVGDPPALPDAGPQLDGGVLFNDATPGDAGLTNVTLSHSASEDIVGGNSVACLVREDTNGDGTLEPQFHTDNSFYRVFDLTAEGVRGDFEISHLRVGVQSASGGADATQPCRVKLHTLSGAFVTANLTELASLELDVPDRGGGVVEIPIAATAPADSTLVVEINTPNGDPDNLMFIGTNDAGETAPTYLRAPACDDDNDSTNGSRLAEPLDLDKIGFNDVHAVISVIGSY